METVSPRTGKNNYYLNSKSLFFDPLNLNIAFTRTTPKFSPKKPKKSILRKNESQPKNVSFADNFGLSLHHVKRFDKCEDFSQILSELANWDWEYDFLGLGYADDFPTNSSLFSDIKLENSNDLRAKRSPTGPQTAPSFNLGSPTHTRPLPQKTPTEVQKERAKLRQRHASDGASLLQTNKTRTNLTEELSITTTSAQNRHTKPISSVTSLQKPQIPQKLPTSERCENLFRIPDLSFNASCEHLCENFPVKLESLVCQTNYILTGTILVRNICFDKKISVRVTGSHWSNFTQVQGSYLNAKCHHTDRFTFKIDLKNLSSVPGLVNHEFASGRFSTLRIPALVELCVQYVAGSNGDLEYWDNNNGENYKLYKISL